MTLDRTLSIPYWLIQSKHVDSYST